MPNQDPAFQKRYEKLMRNAGSRMKRLSRKALEREKAFRENAKRQAQQQAILAQDQGIFIRQLLQEINQLVTKLGSTRSQDERIFIKSEIAQFRRRIDELMGRSKRRPPESGMSVPAVPPNGPLPKQGGAEAPLNFSE